MFKIKTPDHCTCMCRCCGKRFDYSDLKEITSYVGVDERCGMGMGVFCKDCILELISDLLIGVLPVKQVDAVYKLIQNLDEFNSDSTSKNMLQIDDGSDL